MTKLARSLSGAKGIMAGTGQTVEGAASWLAHPAFSYNPGPPAQTGVAPLTESWALPRKSLNKKMPASQSDGNNSSSEVLLLPDDPNLCQSEKKLRGTASLVRRLTRKLTGISIFLSFLIAFRETCLQLSTVWGN